MGERQRGEISTFDSSISNPQNMLLIRQIPIVLLIILGHTACGFSPDVQDIEEDILGLLTTAFEDIQGGPRNASGRGCNSQHAAFHTAHN